MTPSGVCPILYPETGNPIIIDTDAKSPVLGKVAYEVQRQQKLLWPDSSGYGTTQAMSLKLFPISDLMNEDCSLIVIKCPYFFN